MRALTERNPVIIGAIGVTIVAVIVTAALQYQHLPFLDHGTEHSGYFADAGGLFTGAGVEVSGYPVGKVTDIRLDGPQVLVTFTIANNIHLGERTEAAIRTKSLLGTKVLNVTPAGSGTLSGPIPLVRTTSPYQLPDALGDLANTVSGLNTDQLADSLSTLSQTFADTPPHLKTAVEGVARFAQTINDHDAQMRSLLANAAKVTAVLAKRSDDVVRLVNDTNALLAELHTQSNALDQIWSNITAVARQLKGFIAENRTQLKPALDKLNGVLTIVDNRKDRLQKAVKLLNSYAMSLGESVSSGPFFKAYVANLLPGQFVQPFIDAAFSDLGLDPNVLAPNQLSDPQIGQPATPPLPMPYPRTGQGGPPATNLPDAITGHPGDARYPYREPLPAPAPGGPPPGPPAVSPPDIDSTPQPTPTPLLEPAPNEVPAGSQP
ncbi:MAG: MCE family protein [Mycobacterium sp.]|nr:MCE family protein [Mycobacterium sp.]